MKAIFLGKPLHWIVLVVVIVLGAYVGDLRLHVREFNLFIGILFAISTLIVWIVIKTTGPDEQVTRDPLESDEDA